MSMRYDFELCANDVSSVIRSAGNSSSYFRDRVGAFARGALCNPARSIARRNYVITHVRYECASWRHVGNDVLY